MALYRVVAKARKKGEDVVCSMCGKPWTCKPGPSCTSVICGYCINGLVDGLGDEYKVKRKRYMRLYKEYDRKVS